MKTAIFGYAASGKTELFRALSGQQAQNTKQAIVKVPEPRLDPLIKLFKPKKVTYVEIEYLDIPGGGSPGKGVGQRVLNEIKPFECLLAVLDDFSGLLPPDKQYRELESDLMITDLAVVEKRLERIQVDKKKGKGLVHPREEELLGKIKAVLEQEVPLRTEEELLNNPLIRGFSFLSAKPVLYIQNVSENKLDIVPMQGKKNQAHLVLSSKLERELSELEDPAERLEFLQELGLQESALDKIIGKTYDLLGLITFLTVGEKEVRAWSIPRGASAWEAAGAIHSDIQKGFIRAEVLGWQDFEYYGNFKNAKQAGVLRLEGKDYIVRDGDIITFRFNV